MKGNNAGFYEKLHNRHPLYNENVPIILFWSQKSGCSTLTKWFFFHLGLLSKALAVHPSIHIYTSRFYLKPERIEAIKKALFDKEKPTIKLVRNPFIRAVSSFLHVVHYYDQVGFRDVWMELYLRENCLSFKQFLYKIHEIGTEAEKIDGHIAMQYTEGEEEFVRNHIRLENFNESIRFLEKKLKLKPSPIEDISKAPDHKSTLFSPIIAPSSNYSEKMLSKESLLEGNLPTYKHFFDQETTELCRELFKDDFEKYKYSKELNL